MYTLKEIRKILHIKEQDREKDSWTDEDAVNEGDGKPFTPFELAILKLIHTHMNTEEMNDVLTDHAYPGQPGKKWESIAKLVGLNYETSRSSMEDVAVDKRYVKWALDNWTEDGDYASITKPIKVPPKRYHVNRDETGSQVEYKSGSANVIAYDEDNAAETAENEFWDWGGEMETDNYGDWETFDSEITSTNFEGLVSEEKQKQFKNLIKLYRLGEKYTPKIVGDVTKETLVEFLKENINDMVYRETPKDAHIKRMKRSLGPLEGFPLQKFKNILPPENESTQTEEEIDYLDNIPVEKELVHSADDIDLHFKKFLTSKGLEFPTIELNKVMKGVKSIILQLKYHYNRPRPFQVAKAKNLKLDSEYLQSASTPSYPSGHATQGTFIARYLTHLYPQYEKELKQIGEDIAFSRNMAKVHYPSDSEFGKVLGDGLYEFVYQPEIEIGEEVKPNTRLDGDQSHFIRTLEKLQEDLYSDDEERKKRRWEYLGKKERKNNKRDSKLLVPVDTLRGYGDTYLKEEFKKDLTGILDCLEKTCYQIGNPDELMPDEEQDYDHNCKECSEALNETLQSLDKEFIKMGFLKGSKSGWLEKPFPVHYNRWVEEVMQEINPNFFIDEFDELTYRGAGNPWDAYYGLAEQISPEALQDFYAFYGEELDLDERKLEKRMKDFVLKKKDEDTNGIDLSQDDNLLKEHKELNPPLKIGDEILVIDTYKGTRLVSNGRPQSLEPQTYKPYRVFARGQNDRVHGEHPKEDTTFFALEPIDITDEQRLNDYISGGGKRRGQAHLIAKDTWMLNDKTINDPISRKREINPELEVGDIIRMVDLHNREGDGPEIFSLYKVITSKFNKLNRSNYGNIVAEVISIENQKTHPHHYDVFSDPYVRHVYPGDSWVHAEPPEVLQEHKDPKLNPSLNMGDVIRVVDVDKDTGYKQSARTRSGYRTLSRNQLHGEDSFPKTMETYYVISSHPNKIEEIGILRNWVGGGEMTKPHFYWNLLPIIIGEEVPVFDKGTKILTSNDKWIMVNKHTSNIPGEIATRQKEIDDSGRDITSRRLNESVKKKRELSPPLENGDIIRVIEVDGEHSKMPTTFEVYVVVEASGRKEEERSEEEREKRGRWRAGKDGLLTGRWTGEWYAILPLRPTVTDEAKYLYRGDVWVKETWPPKLNESPTEQKDISPILKHGDIIRVIDVPAPTLKLNDNHTTRVERENYAFGQPKLFTPYWVWHPSYGTPKREGTYIIIPIEEVEDLRQKGYLLTVDGNEGLPGHLHKKLKILERNRGDKWLKTNPTETLNEQQFPFNPQNKDMERDHPEGEPEWSIRRGKQHYAMNVENTPTESRTAFNNYLVKNSPFIIDGFDFYLSAVPGNMPGEAMVDVYVPMMDDSAVADEIWNTERTYITREYSDMGNWESNDDIVHYEFTEHTDMLHNIGYDQKFGEYYYYEDFQEKFPEHIEQISTQLEDTNLLNAPGKQYEHIWRSKRNILKREMEDLSKLFGLDRIVINRDPQRPWKRQVDSYGNEEIRPGKSVPREWPRP